MPRLDTSLRAQQPSHLPHTSIWSSFLHFCAFIVAATITTSYQTVSLTFSVLLLLSSYSCCVWSLFCSSCQLILLLQHKTALHKEYTRVSANVSACIKKYQHTQDLFFPLFPAPEDALFAFLDIFYAQNIVRQLLHRSMDQCRNICGLKILPVKCFKRYLNS